MERTTASLSGGEQQLLSLAATMTGSPRVLLLDEPCAALDPAAEEKFLQVLLRLNRELGVTVLMSTHTPAQLWHRRTACCCSVPGAVSVTTIPMPLLVPCGKAVTPCCGRCRWGQSCLTKYR